jgi:hypothetical protein
VIRLTTIDRQLRPAHSQHYRLPGIRLEDLYLRARVHSQFRQASSSAPVSRKTNHAHSTSRGHITENSDLLLAFNLVIQHVLRLVVIHFSDENMFSKKQVKSELILLYIEIGISR